MQIKVKYFASLREQAGTNNELIETQATTGLELFEELKLKHNFTLEQKHIRLAVNEEYADFTRPLTSNDTVVFIPPVAGG